MTFWAAKAYTMNMNNPSNERRVLSVSQLNRSVRQLLELHLPMLWIEGEISNLARPGSGHWYLTLKDTSAQVRCAMFRNSQQRVRFTPSNGMQVLVRCKAGLYEGRGEFQLIIEHMEEAGFGALQRQFEQLKQRLHEEGLFDTRHKRSLPATIRHIGVITSPTGAAITDILAVLARRFPATAVSIYPSMVQGEQAPRQLVDAIHSANRDARCDVLLISRGGGSLEDLWCFNDESVARAIFASELPIVSAVGHEIDVTIADYAADHRAATPSAAAELLSPDWLEINRQLQAMETQLAEVMGRRIRDLQQRSDFLCQRLRHPGQRLDAQRRQLEQLSVRLLRARADAAQRRQMQLEVLFSRHTRQHPKLAIIAHHAILQRTLQQLRRCVVQRLEGAQQRYTQTAQLLDAVSPLKTVGRGYAILRDPEGAVIKSVTSVCVGDPLKAQVGDGEILFAVTETTAVTLLPRGDQQSPVSPDVI